MPIRKKSQSDSLSDLPGQDITNFVNKRLLQLAKRNVDPESIETAATKPQIEFKDVKDLTGNIKKNLISALKMFSPVELVDPDEDVLRRPEIERLLATFGKGRLVEIYATLEYTLGLLIDFLREDFFGGSKRISKTQWSKIKKSIEEIISLYNDLVAREEKVDILLEPQIVDEIPDDNDGYIFEGEYTLVEDIINMGKDLDVQIAQIEDLVDEIDDSTTFTVGGQVSPESVPLRFR